MHVCSPYLPSPPTFNTEEELGFAEKRFLRGCCLHPQCAVPCPGVHTVGMTDLLVLLLSGLLLCASDSSATRQGPEDRDSRPGREAPSPHTVSVMCLQTHL